MTGAGEQELQLALRNLKLQYPNIEEIQRIYGDALVNTPAGERGAFFSVDPGGIFGTRQSLIEELSQTYKPGQGFQIGFNARAVGITPQDLANYRMTQFNQQRKALDPRYDYGLQNFPEGQKPNAATTSTDLAQSTSRVATGKKLTDEILSTSGGPEMLAAQTAQLGRKPTNSELKIIKTKAENNTPEAIQARDLAGAKIEQVEQATQASKDSTRISEGNLELNRINSANAQKLGEYERDYRDAEMKYKQEESARLYAFQAQEGNANRQLQFQLADMNRQERNEDRDARERREDRDRRQLMILQLMKGLKELGQRFSL